jgi:quinolinate synthase
MADMAEPEDLIAMKKEHPGAMVVTYINSTAEIKGLSDVCCTSANAVKVVQRVEAREIIFVPDRNLGSYVQKFTDKEIILWKGFCPTHDRFTAEELRKAKERQPDAIVMVHPECRPEVAAMADEVLSTGGMVRFARATHGRKIIVGTETGMLYKLRSVNSDNEYIPASDSFTCPNMKRITLEKIRDSLVSEEPVVTVRPETAAHAEGCLRKMLELSG